MNDREKQLARVKALLAKTTDRGATQEEAMLAAAKAAQIMDEHNISLSEATEAETKHFTRRDVSPKERWKAEFYVWIGYQVGRFTGTVSTAAKHSLRGQYAHVTFWGQQGDVAFAEWLIQMLGDFVFAGYLADLKLKKQHFGKYFNRNSQKRHRDGYLLGAAQAIIEKLRVMTAEREHNAATRNALTVVDKWQAAKAETEKHTVGDVKQRQGVSADKSAFDAGIERGKQANFHKPVGYQEQRPLAIAGPR